MKTKLPFNECQPTDIHDRHGLKPAVIHQLIGHNIHRFYLVGSGEVQGFAMGMLAKRGQKNYLRRGVHPTNPLWMN